MTTKLQHIQFSSDIDDDDDDVDDDVDDDADDDADDDDDDDDDDDVDDDDGGDGDGWQAPFTAANLLTCLRMTTKRTKPQTFIWRR
jgi:hypothetical protein